MPFEDFTLGPGTFFKMIILKIRSIIRRIPSLTTYEDLNFKSHNKSFSCCSVDSSAGQRVGKLRVIASEIFYTKYAQNNLIAIVNGVLN